MTDRSRATWGRATWGRATWGRAALGLGALVGLCAAMVAGAPPALAQGKPLTLANAQKCLGGLRQSRKAFQVMAGELPRYYSRKSIRNKQHVIMIDYTKNQVTPRLYVVDLSRCKIVHKSKIIHGGAWYHYKANRPDPSWRWSNAKQKWYRRINLNASPLMLTTCRNSIKGGSTHMTRPGWMYTGTCHPNANEGWVKVKAPSCTGYGIQVKPLQGQALGGVTFHDHVRLHYSQHVGQGSLGFERGGTQALINAIKGRDNVNITRGNLVYVYAPQCG